MKKKCLHAAIALDVAQMSNALTFLCAVIKNENDLPEKMQCNRMRHIQKHVSGSLESTKMEKIRYHSPMFQRK